MRTAHLPCLAGGLAVTKQNRIKAKEKNMNNLLTTILSHLFTKAGDFARVFEPEQHFSDDKTDEQGIARSLNACFLIMLAGKNHPLYSRAKEYTSILKQSPGFSDIATFYEKGIELIHREIDYVYENDQAFAKSMDDLCEWLCQDDQHTGIEKTQKKIWSVFFPEAEYIHDNWEESVAGLRAGRTVTIQSSNTSPINDPGREILFTSNVLLTPGPVSMLSDKCRLSEQITDKCMQISRENQDYWYDHPVPIGTPLEKNEVVYGLKGLDDAIEFESSKGNFSGEAITCVLSVSVTHKGLHDIAKCYLEEELHRMGGLKNIDVYVFTENDTKRIIHEVLVPLGEHLSYLSGPGDIPEIFGVDGEYGRHYSFLKAISAFWNIFINQDIKATFKIDLDQVFDQDKLVEQTGASAFDHFKTPLWGAGGVDSRGNPVEMGMIAGALVNESDIKESLFTPDVKRPGRDLNIDEYIFFSTLPQALSTQAEMMTRYGSKELDGEKTCIERIHVTGGTNGILVNSLLRYRPFTPTFIGRAEDQAFILSVFEGHDSRLAYLHKDGLIMRHDKEAFARDAIDAAYLGKLVGDYIRILYFSAYARVLTHDINSIKELADPFTGCFISKIPMTVVYLRFAMKAATFFASGDMEKGQDFIRLGSRRILAATDFIYGSPSELTKQYLTERRAWNTYYDILLKAREKLKEDDHFTMEMCKKAQEIIKGCHITF
jgi:hypothetical protein